MEWLDPCEPGMLVAECMAARALAGTVTYMVAIKTLVLLVQLLVR